MSSSFLRKLHDLRPVITESAPSSMENQLILDWFVVTGAADVALTFAAEAGLPEPDSRELRMRAAVVAAVREGDIDTAVACIAEYDSSALSSDPDILFELRRHQLAQMIANAPLDSSPDPESLIRELVAFAQAHLVPLVGAADLTEERQADMTRRLETVMGLLLYPGTDLGGGAQLLAADELERLARDVNVALLKWQNHSGVSKLVKALQIVNWAQAQPLPSISPDNSSAPGVRVGGRTVHTPSSALAFSAARRQAEDEDMSDSSGDVGSATEAPDVPPARALRISRRSRW